MLQIWCTSAIFVSVPFPISDSDASADGFNGCSGTYCSRCLTVMTMGYAKVPFIKSRCRNIILIPECCEEYIGSTAWMSLALFRGYTWLMWCFSVDRYFNFSEPLLTRLDSWLFPYFMAISTKKIDIINQENADSAKFTSPIIYQSQFPVFHFKNFRGTKF